MAVALVGRSNVGKSSLFNRLIGKRKALVWNQKGVTRDLVKGEMRFSGERTLELWDLAGVSRETEGRHIQNLDSSLKEKIDALIIVIDGSEPLSVEDEDAIRAARKLNRPLLVAVNKADKKLFSCHQGEILKFFKKDVFELSAETAEGVDALCSRLEDFAAVKETANESEKRILILGRPNAGKSSLLNRLAGEDIAVVSDQAGTTRDPVEGLVKRRKTLFRFVDSAGVRKKGKIFKKEDPVEIFSTEKAKRELERSQAVILISEAHPAANFDAQDRKLLRLIRESALPAIIVVNKWDLVRKKWKEEEYRKELKAQLGDLSLYPILFISAKTGHHCEKIFQILEDFEKRQKIIPTSRLNQWLQNTLQEKQLRVVRHGQQVGRKRSATQYLHLSYIVQTKASPLTFQIFCNAPHAVAAEDERFLVNRLRKAFSIVGLPIKLIFRRKN